MISAEKTPDNDVTIFEENGARFCTGGERSEEFLWMEDIPSRLENER